MKTPIFADRVIAFFAPVSWDMDAEGLSWDWRRLQRRPLMFVVRNLPVAFAFAFMASQVRDAQFQWSALMAIGGMFAMMGHVAGGVLLHQLVAKWEQRKDEKRERVRERDDRPK